MRVTVTTGGSRGDLQPYVALGLGLKRRGIDVRIATAPEFEDFVGERGLEFAPVRLDVQSIIGELIETGNSTVALARGLAEQFGPAMDQNVTDYWAATEDADAVIWGPSGFLGRHIAEARGIASAAADMQPILRPTAAYRPSVVPPLPQALQGGRSERVANRLSFFFVHEIFWQSFKRFINRTLSERLGLEPMIALEPGRRSTDLPEPVLCGWSPTVLPRPADYGERMHVTGYWFLDEAEGYEPPQRLADFLESGPAPVSVGFGSMNRKVSEKMIETLTTALSRTGQRAVFLTGWSGITQSDLPDEVLAIEQVPHDWLFPRVAAAIHHGGAGTTAASLRAGTPTVTVPIFFDQRFWGERVAALGAGPEPLLHDDLNAERLTAALAQATSQRSMRESAMRVGRTIEAEHGVESAVQALIDEGVVSGAAVS